MDNTSLITHYTNAWYNTLSGYWSFLNTLTWLDTPMSYTTDLYSVITPTINDIMTFLDNPFIIAFLVVFLVLSLFTFWSD